MNFDEAPIPLIADRVRVGIRTVAGVPHPEDRHRVEPQRMAIRVRGPSGAARDPNHHPAWFAAGSERAPDGRLGRVGQVSSIGTR
ncbi:hypothetical protein J3R03_004818 [Actinoplanes couchii]|nr:hypothetical protein [Actinoplanes couchii]